LQDLTLSNCWCEGEELLLPILPRPANGLTSLTMDARSLCAHASLEALPGLKNLEQLVLTHGAAAITESVVGYSVPPEQIVALLHTAVAALQRLQRVGLRPFAIQPHPRGWPWLSQGVLAALDALSQSNPGLQLLF
jgi:hypothetical protein